MTPGRCIIYLLLRPPPESTDGHPDTQRCPAPAESLKPERHTPPRIGAKLISMLLRRLGSATVGACLPPGFTICSRHRSRTGPSICAFLANERKDRLALVARIVVALGHELIAREIEVEDVGPVTARERPDVALVGLGASSERALDLIDKIVREAACLSSPSCTSQIPGSSRKPPSAAFSLTSQTTMSRTGKARSNIAAAVVGGHRLLRKQPQPPLPS